MAKVVAIPQPLRTVLSRILPDVTQAQLELSAAADTATGEQQAAMRATAQQLDEVENAIANLLVSQDELDRNSR